MVYKLNSHLNDGKVGVIDIGSNTIRLVVYDGIKRVPHAIYNYKVFCGLAKGLSKSSRLNTEGVKLARRAIARLIASVRLMQVSELHIIATAAIREADDGKAFVKEIERTHHVNIRIISGKKEARYAALGIISTSHQHKGLAGDLGGGSLELVSLDDEALNPHHTLPLGPLRLQDRAGENREFANELITQQLKLLPWLRD